MDRYMGIIRLALLCLAFQTAAAHAEVQYPIRHQRDRFVDLLNSIERGLADYNPNAEFQSRTSVIDNVRESLTQLQNAFRFYSKNESKKNPEKNNPYAPLTPYYEQVKELEDHISHLRDRGGGGEAYEKEKASYEKLMRESDWFKKGEQSLINQMRASIEKVQWPSLEEDRDFLLKKLAKHFEKRHKEEYDFKLLEDGIHEFRRDTRRLSYFNQAVFARSGKRSTRIPCASPSSPMAATSRLAWRTRSTAQTGKCRTCAVRARVTTNTTFPPRS